LVPKNGEISLHIFVDRVAVDIFGGGGSLYMPMAESISPGQKSLKLSCQGGKARLVSMKVYELKSAW
jgi:sucrose-6-phosphate hydrolase SacC (GH32 family)